MSSWKLIQDEFFGGSKNVFVKHGIKRPSSICWGMLSRTSTQEPCQRVIHQELDHFDSNRKDTFPQRFFVNEKYWEEPDGPVFLFIGGEAAISEVDVLAGMTLTARIHYRGKAHRHSNRGGASRSWARPENV
ncbi:lysosomal Pro-X carboxypeptidase-like [Alosa sapidissima]|uniref:lysosomal Pro-X carboxypeptidase-like n=1 Tax=Alosa sapidissima TaxID=34773 RepID=UPI001C09162C|nr:lysosomal Pro-X carboxypeptidase-like [Alosa sapidissima]